LHPIKQNKLNFYFKNLTTNDLKSFLSGKMRKQKLKDGLLSTHYEVVQLEVEHACALDSINVK
jgi:hypothetical protein